MFGRLIPREGRFFEYFTELAECVVQASHELSTLMSTFEDLERRARNIESIEKKATRSLMPQSSFCTRPSLPD